MCTAGLSTMPLCRFLCSGLSLATSGRHSIDGGIGYWLNKGVGVVYTATASSGAACTTKSVCAIWSKTTRNGAKCWDTRADVTWRSGAEEQNWSLQGHCSQTLRQARRTLTPRLAGSTSEEDGESSLPSDMEERTTPSPVSSLRHLIDTAVTDRSNHRSDRHLFVSIERT